jgi:hypothetical protein
MAGERAVLSLSGLRFKELTGGQAALNKGLCGGRRQREAQPSETNRSAAKMGRL